MAPLVLQLTSPCTSLPQSVVFGKRPMSANTSIDSLERIKNGRRPSNAPLLPPAAENEFPGALQEMHSPSSSGPALTMRSVLLLRAPSPPVVLLLMRDSSM